MKRRGVDDDRLARTMMSTKPRLGFWQIWNMCFGFMGIQFGFALQNSNVSRIFQTLGASVDDIPVLWIAAPLTGLLVQPIVGYLSDRTWNTLGRRRPYFLAGAILATLALVAMPNSPSLWIAAGLLWILDASINISMEPFRAFVGDQLPSSQRASGYSMQSFFIGVGSVVASMLPWLLAKYGVSNTAAAGAIPDTVKFAFYAGAIALFGAIGWTVLSTREYPPEALALFDGARIEQMRAPVRGAPMSAWAWLAAGIAASCVVYLAGIDRQLYLLAGGIAAYGLVQLVVGASRSHNLFTEIVADMHAMPTTMRQLAVVQFFSWFALFAMWIYTTAAVTSVHFGSSDAQSAAYNEGANWVGVLFAAYNGFAALAAIVIPAMSKRLGLRGSHCVNLCLGGLGLASFLLIQDPHWLLLSMVGVGFRTACRRRKWAFTWASSISSSSFRSCSRPACSDFC